MRDLLGETASLWATIFNCLETARCSALQIGAISATFPGFQIHRSVVSNKTVVAVVAVITKAKTQTKSFLSLTATHGHLEWKWTWLFIWSFPGGKETENISAYNGLVWGGWEVLFAGIFCVFVGFSWWSELVSTLIFTVNSNTSKAVYYRIRGSDTPRVNAV